MPEQARKLRSRSKKVEPNVAPGELRHRNLAKFKVLFDERLPRVQKTKAPKMEGVDTVIMETKGQCRTLWDEHGADTDLEFGSF